MGFTDHCDIFAAFHEDGFNRVLHHVRRQRPSLFNYATAEVANNPKLWCRRVDTHPVVAQRGNPVFTIEKPLPVPGSHFGLNFMVQLADLRVDFHPGDELALPPELGSTLAPQRLAIKLTVCGGLGCPPKEVVDELVPRPSRPPNPSHDPTGAAGATGSTVVLPVGRLHCFCLDAVATGGVRIATYDDRPYLEPFLDGLEIVEIRPEGLESSLECYLTMLLKLVVLPGLRILLQHAPLNLTQGATDLFPQPTNVQLSPMPVSAALPHNPAIEDDQLKAFIKVEVM